MSDEIKNFPDHLSDIRKYGMDQDEWEATKMSVRVLSWSEPHLAVAYVEHLKEQNDILKECIDKIASGMLTIGESKELAQYTLELTSLRKWRNADEQDNRS